MAKGGGGSGRGGGGGAGAKSPDAVAKRLEALGGKRWTKGGKDRVYFDAEEIASAAGLRYSTYNSGNISSATYGGSAISNSVAKRILGGMPQSVWFDLGERVFYRRGDPTGDARGVYSSWLAKAKRAAGIAVASK